MTEERSRGMDWRSALTALATLVGLLLFIGASVWLYETFGSLGQSRDEAEAARARQLAVQARNEAVLEGREPGTRPLETALKEFLERQESGQATFPLPPPPAAPSQPPAAKGPETKQPASDPPEAKVPEAKTPEAKTPEGKTPEAKGAEPKPGDGQPAPPMPKDPKAAEPAKALAPAPREAPTHEPVTTP